MTYVDSSIARVRQAASKGKKPLADIAGLRDTVLRGSEASSWNPTANTLRALERAADAVIGKEESGAAPAKAHPESVAKSPVGRGRRAAGAR